MWKNVIDFVQAKKRSEDEARSVIGRQIEATLCPGMVLPSELEMLFRWIEGNGYFIDTKDRRIGFLSSRREIKAGWTKAGRPGGTDIGFEAEGNVNLSYWFGTDDPDVIQRLCVFARTGGDGSMAAFWLADDGTQKIVHMGSGSGSTTVCVLSDHPVDFLRLLAIGYDEICWGEMFSAPPNASREFVVAPNRPFVDWVRRTFQVDIPERGSEIVRHHAKMHDVASDDPFWQWVQNCPN